MDGKSRGNSGNGEEVMTCVSPAVFAVILTFSHPCVIASILFRKLLLYPPELRGRLDLRAVRRILPGFVLSVC